MVGWQVEGSLLAIRKAPEKANSVKN